MRSRWPTPMRPTAGPTWISFESRSHSVSCAWLRCLCDAGWQHIQGLGSLRGRTSSWLCPGPFGSNDSCPRKLLQPGARRRGRPSRAVPAREMHLPPAVAAHKGSQGSLRRLAGGCLRDHNQSGFTSHIHKAYRYAAEGFAYIHKAYRYAAEGLAYTHKAYRYAAARLAYNPTCHRGWGV